MASQPGKQIFAINILWNQPQACNLIKKETLAQVLSCDICDIPKNTFFTEHICTTAPEKGFSIKKSQSKVIFQN